MNTSAVALYEAYRIPHFVLRDYSPTTENERNRACESWELKCEAIIDALRKIIHRVSNELGIKIGYSEATLILGQSISGHGSAALFIAHFQIDRRLNRVLWIKALSRKLISPVALEFPEKVSKDMEIHFEKDLNLILLPDNNHSQEKLLIQNDSKQATASFDEIPPP